MLSPERDQGLPRVSLIVPIRNEAKHIGDCIRGIQAQSYPAELLEIIVVDGASADDTVSIVERLATEDQRIRLLTNPDRAMPQGLNLGIQASKGVYVGVVSGHSVLPLDYVSLTVRILQETGSASVGGRIVRTATKPMQRAIAAATASRIGVGDSRHNYATEAGWVETVFPGFWPRDLFDRVGWFDPAMVANEDNELSLRIRKAGERIWYDPRIAVEYAPRASLRGLFHQYRRYGLGKMRVLRKHRGGLRWRHLAPAAWLGWVVLGGAVSLLVPIVAVAWWVLMATYVMTIVLASLRLQERGVPWWMIALALVTVHVAYGVGTWQGIATWLRRA